MKQVENKNRRESGMRISELAIVLAVTLVLTAILMPAIASTTPERAEEILSASVVMDGLVRPRQPAERQRKSDRRDNRLSADTGQAAGTDMDEYVRKTRISKGMNKMLTTDIRRRQP